MKKSHGKGIDKVTFKVSDSRKTPNGNEYDIEVNKELQFLNYLGRINEMWQLC